MNKRLFPSRFLFLLMIIIATTVALWIPARYTFNSQVVGTEVDEEDRIFALSQDNPYTAAIVFATGGLDNNSWNQEYYKGALAAQQDYGIDFTYVLPAQQDDVEGHIRDYAQHIGFADPYSIIICTGFNAITPLQNVADDFPDQKFAIMDSQSDWSSYPNVINVEYDHAIAPALVGAMAGLITTQNKIAFIGGVANPYMIDFENGFFFGVGFTNPSALWNTEWVGDFSNATKAEELANASYLVNGDDIIFAAVGAAGMGVFNSARKIITEGSNSSPIWVIGVDTPQMYLGTNDPDNPAPPTFALTCALKKLDNAMKYVIGHALYGTLPRGDRLMALPNRGVDYEVNSTLLNINPSYIDQIETLRENIISGTAAVPGSRSSEIPLLYEPHGPIEITSDAEFATQATLEGWKGDGSPGDPYIIEGYGITNNALCIYVRDVSAHFIIRHCQIASYGGPAPEGEYDDGLGVRNADHCKIYNNTFIGKTETGAWFWNSNSTIANNTFANNNEGLHLSHSTDCKVSDNTFLKCGLVITGDLVSEWDHQIGYNLVNGKPIGYFWSEIGTIIDGGLYGQIILANCSWVTVHDGVFINASSGIRLGFCSDCKLISNMVANCTRDGVHITYSAGCNLTGNDIIRSGGNGAYLLESMLCTFWNNWITENERGIYLQFSNNANITGNYIHDNKKYGVFTWAQFCSFSDNTFENDGIGMHGEEVNDWRHWFSGDTLNGKPIGYFWSLIDTPVDGSLYGQVILANCSRVEVQNGLFNGIDPGVLLGHSPNCTIKDSEFYGSYVGFEICWSPNCTVLNVTADGNDYGASVYQSNTTSIIDTEISASLYEGMRLSSSDNCTLDNNNIHHNHEGVHFINSGGAFLIDNKAYSNIGQGLWFSDSGFCTLDNNDVFDNGGIGLEADNSPNATLVGNTLYGNEHGAGFYGSLGCEMIGNTVFSNAYSGIHFSGWGYDWSSPYGTVNLNAVYGNGGNGIEIVGTEYCTVAHNEVYGNTQDGILVLNSNHITLTNNTVNDNDWVGIRADWSNDSTFYNNSVFSSGSFGMHFDSCRDCIIQESDIFENLLSGVHLFRSLRCDLDNNQIMENLYLGVWLEFSNQSMITSNQVFDNDLSGIWFTRSNSSTVISNDVIQNLKYGIGIGEGSTGNTIYDNTIGWNTLGNALDNGTANAWDNGLDIGNSWGDYYFSGWYPIPGSAGTFDHYPSKADTDLPTVSGPADFPYESGSIGHSITWTSFDDHPHSYLVLRNGTPFDSGAWDGSDVTVNIDNLMLGLHNFTIIVNDTCGNIRTHTVWVTVEDTTSPTINHPNDLTFTQGESGNSITWTPTDVNPSNYEIFIDDARERYGEWTTSGQAITITVDDLSPGQHNVRIIVVDASGNSIQDEVQVNVIAATVTTTTITTTTTTTGIDPLLLTVAGGGIAVVVILGVVCAMMRSRKAKELPPPPTIIEAEALMPAEKTVKALRGGEIIGGKFEYKVKVKNDTDSVINNVNVNILAYPEDCMEIVGPTSKKITRIEPGGFRSPQFTFTPTKDCVEGQVLTTVSFVDHRNQTQMLKVEPYTIRSVCDLLQPLETSLDELDVVLTDMAVTSEKRSLSWNPEVLFHKAQSLMAAKNFYVLEAKGETEDGQFRGVIRGIAEGKYTHKKVALRIVITGAIDGTEASVDVEGLGDDEAMLPTTIEEIATGIDSWTCMNCGGALTPDEVSNLKRGAPIECKYCRHTMTIDLYKK